MTNEHEQSPAVEEVVVRLLVDKTGITIDQAKELINLIGYNLASLIREARFLSPRSSAEDEVQPQRKSFSGWVSSAAALNSSAVQAPLLIRYEEYLRMPVR